MIIRQYIDTQKEWLIIIYLQKRDERKVNERIKSDVSTNRFYEHIEDQKAAMEDGSNSGLFNDT